MNRLLATRRNGRSVVSALALACALSLASAGHAALGATGKIAELDRIVAIANDNVITLSELEAETRTIKQQLRAQNTKPPSDDILHKQVLERLIVKRLQLEIAASNNVRVDDQTLNLALHNIATQNNLSLAQFRDVLEKDGFNFDKFRENIRDEITIRRLQARQVDNRVTVTDREVEDFLATQGAHASANREYHLAHILIAVPEASSPEKIQAARRKAEEVLHELRSGADFSQIAVASSDGQQALQGGDLGWRKAGQLPTIFSDVVVKLQDGEVSDLIRSPSGFHIIKLVKVRGESQHVITQTQARHILLRTNELTSDRDARIRLAQLKERIEGGASFADLARSHSDDKGSAVSGGDLGWVSPGDLVPQFEEAMNALRPGQVSEPFETQFGWHIVQVLSRREYDNTEEFKKAQARNLLRQRKIEEELQTWLRRLRDEAYVEYHLEE